MTKNSENLKQSVFVGRQPIYTSGLDVFGYELLYRNGDVAQSGVTTDGDHATTQVIVNTFMEIGFDQLVGKGCAFINLTRSFIDGSMPLPFPKDRVVLEVLEDIPPEPKVIGALKKLKDDGYTIALDDFIYSPAHQPFVDLADVIKIDIKALTPSQLVAHVRKLGVGKRKLLAEKIESMDDFKFCKQLDFDYYQGYFLSKPTVVEGNRLPSSKLSIMHLLARLQSPDVPMNQLESLVKRDASLTYKLLRYVNSPSLALGKKVSSVQQALIHLGINVLKRWVMLIVMSGVSDKSDELTRVSMIRARMCELLAKQMRKPETDEYFIAGLFSTLDAMLDLPMSEVLESLPLSERVNDALLNKTGSLGEVLSCTLAYERGIRDQTTCKSVPEARIRDIYLESIAWANDAMENMLV
ncbi:MAG: HDOD domain-containing protein [Gammaproteobacteria bacterium]|nr:HDOD domain-containing protein [Gammaproteobacteria bacterium]